MSRFFSPIPLLLANAWDVPSAITAEQAGYQAIGTSSAAIAAMLGYADGEQIPFEEMLLVVRRLRAGSALPLSVDIEAGYSDSNAAIVANVARLAELGVAGINIEDSRVTGGQRALLPAELLAGRLAALRMAFPGLSSMRAPIPTCWASKTHCGKPSRAAACMRPPAPMACSCPALPRPAKSARWRVQFPVR